MHRHHGAMEAMKSVLGDERQGCGLRLPLSLYLLRFGPFRRAPSFPLGLWQSARPPIGRALRLPTRGFSSIHHNSSSSHSLLLCTVRVKPSPLSSCPLPRT
jgi:hypothetical protein